MYSLPICCYHFSSDELFVVKQKAAYDMRISDWSSDVCSSDLLYRRQGRSSVELRGDAEQRAAAVPRRVEMGVQHHRDVRKADVLGPARLQLSLKVRDLLQPRGARSDCPRHHRTGPRSEERRVGKECVRNVNIRWWPLH